MTWRHWRETPGATLLLVGIVAVGVGVYVSIRLANRAALSSFGHFTSLLAAESDGVLQAPSGELPVSVLSELRSRFPGEPVHWIPVVETTATRPVSEAGETWGSRVTFRVLGVDLLGIQNVAREARGVADDWWGQGADAGEGGGAGAGGGDVFWPVFTDPRSVWVSEALARADGLQRGSALPLLIQERVVSLTVAGVIPSPPGQVPVPETLLVMDVAALQQWTGRDGRLTRVEWRVSEGAGKEDRREALRRGLEAAAREWPEGVPARVGARGGGGGESEAVTDGAVRWWLNTPSERREAGAMMTRAFRLNLTLLSLLALLVGWYLVLQALDGAVVRRRAEMAVLRSLGVEEGTLRWLWLFEALVLGMAGGVLGVGLGWLGAQVTVEGVGRTVNALYFATSVRSAGMDVREAAVGVGLAVLATVAAGWWPARQAARTLPAQFLGRGSEAPRAAWVFRHPAVGLVLVLLGWGLANFPPWRLEGGVRVPLGGYLAALFWLVGSGMLGGVVLGWLARGWGWMGRWWVTWRLSAGVVARPTGRQVLATAGLIGAVSMTAAMVILVGSFERTMQGWIERTFQADLYLASAGAQSASTDNRIPAATWRRWVTHPEVADANVVQASELRLRGSSTILASGDLGFLNRQVRLAWVEAPTGADVAWPQGEDGAGRVLVLASESFAERYQMRRGAELVLPTPSGPRPVRVAGVFADYGNERGSLVVDRRYFTEWMGTDQAASVIVKLKDSERAESLRAEWRAEEPGVEIFTNTHLRGEILRIFRQTFAVTHALGIIGLGVSVVGLALTLASGWWERRGELTTLRMLGMTRGELARVAMGEGLMLALGGLAVGLATSLALGWLLIRVINKQTFGWTLEMGVPWGWLLVLASGLILAAGWVSLLVGRWGAELPAEREE
jgi:putative ABC transport system permease protein